MSEQAAPRTSPRPAGEKTVAIVQSSYIPWKGYFDLIDCADEFILYDDVQYTRQDWRNRNRIKGPSGPFWLTIPVSIQGLYSKPINEVMAADRRWPRKHWQAIRTNYARAPYFSPYQAVFEELYLGNEEVQLSRINHRFLMAICRLLGISTPIRWSTDYELVEGTTARLVHLCRQTGATRYLSGPSARDYLEEAQFQEAGITVAYADYSGYPEYHQLFPPFDHYVSIIDLLFNAGPESPRFFRST